MRLSKLTLTNFRSFSSPQTITFSPVTLLFGPNSVGKSSVIMALFYIQKILETGQCNPLRLEALGDKYVGGFKNLVNARDLNKSIVLKVEYEKPELGADYSFLPDIMKEQLGIDIGGVTSESKNVAIELTISWSQQLETAYISKYVVWLDGSEIAEATSDAGMQQPVITDVNYLHPLLLPTDNEKYDEWLVECFDQRLPIHINLLDRVLNLKGLVESQSDQSKDFDLSSAENAQEISEDVFVSKFHELLNISRIPDDGYGNSTYMSGIASGEGTLLHAPISFKGKSGALPVLGKVIKTSLDLAAEDEAEVFDFGEDHANSVFNESLSNTLVAPLDNLLALLKESLCIGPLREIPDPTYQANPYPLQKDWHNGMAAWDVLENADTKLLQSVDQWMSSEDKLDLGYGLAIKVEKSFAELKRVSALHGYDSAERQLNEMIGKLLSSSDKSVVFDENSTRYTYSIWDSSNQIDVTPNEVGVGISQLLPLVVAAFTSRKGFVAIEQPELHIHPRVQVAVGDLLTQIDRGKNFLVETHSEHLILRLLKRIRQTTDKELPDGLNGVTPSDVSIVYLDSSESGVNARKIDIDEDGEFVGRWPRGFFAERREELM